MKKFFAFLLVLAIIGAAFYFLVMKNGDQDTPETVTYTVSFDLQGYPADVAQQTVEENKKASEPTVGLVNGYFAGDWYKDAACTIPYDFNTPVTGNVTLYLSWERNGYFVSFDLSGWKGTAPAVQLVSAFDDSCAVLPVLNGERPGYWVCEWCADMACTISWDFATPITADMTLYAHWYLEEYTLSFDLNGGSEAAPSDQTLTYLELASEPDMDAAHTGIDRPTRAGYSFAGWWIMDESDYVSEWNFTSDIPSSDVTLYAAWGASGSDGTYNYIELTNAVKITDYLVVNTSQPEELTIPSAINGKPVLSIGYAAFEGGVFTKVTLPASLTTICADAFRSCAAIWDLDIPDGVTSVGEMAFWGCSALMDLSIGSGVKAIGEMCFYGCTPLGSTSAVTLEIPGSVLILFENAFGGESSCKYLELNEGLVSIGKYAMQYMDIASLALPDSVETVGDGAFQYCYLLDRMVFGEGIKTIGYQAFKECVLTHHAVFVTSAPPVIGQEAFGGIRESLWIVVPSEAAVTAYASAWSAVYPDYSGHITQYDIQ